MLSRPEDTIHTSTFGMEEVRSTSSVAKRVQRPAMAENLKPEIASRTELFPDDWSPTTTICGSWMLYESPPRGRRLSIMSRSGLRPLLSSLKAEDVVSVSSSSLPMMKDWSDVLVR